MLRKHGVVGDRGQNPTMLLLAKEITHVDRVQILYRLALKPCCVAELAGALQLAECDVSRHLGRLFNRGLVDYEHVGKKHIYRISTEIRVQLDDQMITITLPMNSGLQMTVRGQKPRLIDRAGIDTTPIDQPRPA